MTNLILRIELAFNTAIESSCSVFIPILGLRFSYNVRAYQYVIQKCGYMYLFRLSVKIHPLYSQNLVSHVIAFILISKISTADCD